MKDSVIIYCKYCGKRVEAKSRKRKFCSDSHKGAYSVAQKQYWIVNEKSYLSNQIERLKRLGKITRGINIGDLINNIKEDFSVLEMIADKVMIIEDRKILFFSKDKYPEGIYDE